MLGKSSNWQKNDQKRIRNQNMIQVKWKRDGKTIYQRDLWSEYKNYSFHERLFQSISSMRLSLVLQSVKNIKCKLMSQVEHYWRNAGLAWLSDMLVWPSLYSDDGSKIDRGACGEVASIHFDVLTAEEPISARICSLCSAKYNHISLRMVKKHIFNSVLSRHTYRSFTSINSIFSSFNCT